MKENNTLTVFTPAYNRAHTLPRLYESLLRQTSHDFRWVLVDDGSTDKTKDLVLSWIESGIESKECINGEDRIVVNGHIKGAAWLKICFIIKPNGGMASGHNAAYDHIDTELAVCIDSDDWMPDDGVEKITSLWRRDGKEKYAGMVAQDFFEDGSMVANPFPKDLKEVKAYDVQRKYHVMGDVKYVFRAEVIKQYLPYPVVKGERFMEVNYLYNQMSLKYDYLCYNDCFCIVEYQEDGLTAGIMHQYVQSPKSYMHTRNVYMMCLPKWKEKFRHAIHYVSSAIFARDLKFLYKANRKDLVLTAIPLGVLVNLYIRYKNRK